MYTQKVLFDSLVLKNLNIFIFPIVKMATKYAEIGREGKLKACFQPVSLV